MTAARMKALVGAGVGLYCFVQVAPLLLGHGLVGLALLAGLVALCRGPEQ